MREPKIYWKKSHLCYYVNINRKTTRLDPDKEKALTLYHQLMASKGVVKPSYPVVALLEKFLDHHKLNSKPETFRFYQQALDSFAHFIGPKLKVKDLKTHHVTRWLTERHRVIHRGGKPTEKLTSDNYRHNLIRAVKAAFNWAVNEDYLEITPLKKLTPPSTRPRDVYLMPEEWDKLIAKAAQSPDQGCLLDIITIMKETGCRPLEARSVESRHFDRGGKCWVFSAEESKGEREPRIVLLNNRAFDICQRLAMKYPEGPLFRNSNGRPWTRQSLGYRLYRLSKKLGFDACPYAIRHTFATDAIIRGVDLQTIASLMGHVDLKMLSRIYQHLRKRSDHLREGLRRATGEVA